MICAIRITGDVNLNSKVRETLNRLNLRRKYSCTLLEENKINLGMVAAVRDFIAYGEIDDKTLKELVEKRAQLIDKTKKVDAAKIVEEIKKHKKFKELNLKPFFRLHPPRKGIDTKKHFGVKRGVLGDNKEKINELVGRML